MNEFKYCVVIGRFQPFHNGHYEIIKQALSRAEKVLVIIGSHKKAPDVSNPWFAPEREEIISFALTKEEQARIDYHYVCDFWYQNNKWVTTVQQVVFDATDGCEDEKICIIGAENYFPQWHFYYQKNIDNMPHATTIRDLYFTHDNGYKNHVHPKVASYLDNFKTTEKFKLLKHSYDYLKAYHAGWDGAPFRPIFHTVDAVVIKSGHVLLVRRRGALGKGQLALPGGFLNQDETILDGALRELREETVIKVSKETLESSIKEEHCFDHPKRSLRGRVITNAFLIDLGKTGLLPAVKGSDDAEKAQWHPLGELPSRQEEFFEDHFHILSFFCNKY